MSSSRHFRFYIHPENLCRSRFDDSLFESAVELEDAPQSPFPRCRLRIVRTLRSFEDSNLQCVVRNQEFPELSRFTIEQFVTCERLLFRAGVLLVLQLSVDVAVFAVGSVVVVVVVLVIVLIPDEVNTLTLPVGQEVQL